MNARIHATLALLALLVVGQSSWAQCESWLQGPMDDGSLPNGADGNIFAAMTWDPDGAGPLQERLIVGGDFTSIGGVPANNIAWHDPASNQWYPMGSGINAGVRDLILFDGTILAASPGDNNVGTFDVTVHRWNGTGWDDLPATNTGHVTRLFDFNGTLYIAGSFMTHFVVEGGNPAHYIARYVPEQFKWQAVENAQFGSETGTGARALAVYNGELYAGGFKDHPTQVGSTPHLARSADGFNWTVISNGTDSGGISDFANFAGELIVVGGFGSLLGATCNSVAGWNGVSMHAFHTGTSSSGPTSSAVNSVWVHQGIVIGGAFDQASGLTVNHTARWAPGGSSWAPLGTGTDNVVHDLTTYRGELVAVGQFTSAGMPANRIAHWNGTNWSPFGGGSASWVLSYAFYNGRLVAGGLFSQPTATLGTANNIVGWNGGSFSSFGTGMNNQVVALESFKYAGISGDYELIAGGNFTTAGGIGALRIARWREDPLSAFPPPAWEALGAGFNNTVQAIERASNVTYAGGAFTQSGVTVLNYVGRWNETTDVWENMGGGMNGTVNALKEYNGSLYAGGAFSTASGAQTGGFARWNGSAWVPVGGFFLGTVYALEVHDGVLYIGGSFPGLPNGSNIAAYNGSSYFNVGSGGANSAVTELLSAGSRLYAGGSFTAIGGVSANRVGYWDGANWNDASGGADANVSALGRAFNETHVGGTFGNVNGGLLPSPRWARYSESGLPWFSLHPSPFNQTAPLGSNVVFSSATGGGFPDLFYQWTKDGQPIFDGPQADGSFLFGTQTQVLNIANVVWSDQGSYRIEVSNACGTVVSSPGTLSIDPTATPETQLMQTAFRFLGPNPSGGETVLAFSLAQAANARFAVHDLRGRRVREVELGALGPGMHQAHWDARDGEGRSVAAGVYFIALHVDGSLLEAKRVTILR